MSRRKNFGEGYGYTFHGAFTEKADAEKKEAKTPGSFIRGTPTAKGYRWMVMKPRKNPSRRSSGGKKPRVKTYTLRSSLTKKTRKATMVVLPDGREHKFDEIVPKRIAIREALRHLGIGDNPCMVGINPQRYEVIEISADKKRRVLVAGVTKEEGRESLKRMKLLWGKYGIKFELKPQSARNPVGVAELIVMGANPGDDPYYVEAVRELFPGKAPADLTTQEVSRALQLAARLKHQRTGTNPRQNVEFGEFEKGIFHPWTRRPKTRRKHAIRRRASNPSAEAIREYFTGAPVSTVRVENEPHMEAGDYAQLGELLVLYVKPVGGGQVKQIAFRGLPRPAVVADETAHQIWFVAGDQDISASLEEFGAQPLEGEASGVFLLGEARRIDYKQRKEHVPDPDVDEWRHEFGEETGVRPALLFDSDKKRLLLSGGEYEIRPEGIVN